MSGDEHPSMFSRRMEAIAYLTIFIGPQCMLRARQFIDDDSILYSHHLSFHIV